MWLCERLSEKCSVVFTNTCRACYRCHFRMQKLHNYWAWQQWWAQKRDISKVFKASEMVIDDCIYDASYVAACGFLDTPCQLPCAKWIKMRADHPALHLLIHYGSKKQNFSRHSFISRLQALIQLSKAHNLLPNLSKSVEQMLTKAYEKMTLRQTNQFIFSV